MAILIANLGTSDIAVKVGKYYLPLGFDRQEPNLKEPDQNTHEGSAWHGRWTLLGQLQQELGLLPNPKFRDFSGALLSAYHEKPEEWHPRISIGRILGVIEAAIATEAQRHDTPNAITTYLITTDQPPTEISGYPTDTIYAFALIQEWLSKEKPAFVTGDYPKINLIPNTVTVSAINEDALHEHYYQLFQTFDPGERVYLSVKGGTYQMQQALKVQALSSNTKTQIFLSPKPLVSKILAGKSSECNRISYWKYQQNQKYELIRQLLERWDFDGAAALLRQWRESFQGVAADNQLELNRYLDTLGHIVQGLEMAVAHMNLDLTAARAIAAGNTTLEGFLSQYEMPENLYAQCNIYYELNRISHFLSHLGSFYEASQKYVISELGYPYPNQLIKRGRFAKWTFIEQKINDEQQAGRLAASFSKQSWKKLDFWYDVRNTLIHGAAGINKDRLKDTYQQRDLTNDNAQTACADNQILSTMQEVLAALGQWVVALNPGATPWGSPSYGIYGEIKNWTLISLKDFA